MGRFRKVPEKLLTQLLRLPVGRLASRRERIIDPTSQDNSTSAVVADQCPIAVRQCFRKGCENRYQPRQWNQRFCQEPSCRLEVSRWRATKRQRKWRSVPENRASQAIRDRARRERERQQPQSPLATASQADLNVEATLPSEPLELPAAPSRNSNIPENFCDRPGCYEATRSSHRNHAKFCSNACQRAMQSVRDRERKWLARWRARQGAVLNYGRNVAPRLSFQHSNRSDKDHAQADSGCRPRPPPAGW